MKIFMLSLALILIPFKSIASAEEEKFLIYDILVSAKPTDTKALSFEFSEEFSDVLLDADPHWKKISCTDHDQCGDLIPMWCSMTLDANGRIISPWSTSGAVQKPVQGFMTSYTALNKSKPMVKSTFTGLGAEHVFNFLTIKSTMDEISETKKSDEMICTKNLKSSVVTCIWTIN